MRIHLESIRGTKKAMLLKCKESQAKVLIQKDVQEAYRAHNLLPTFATQILYEICLCQTRG